MFKDQSIFNGWFEFETPIGRVRAENCGLDVYRVFKQSGDAFVACATVHVTGKNNLCERIYRSWIDGDEE